MSNMHQDDKACKMPAGFISTERSQRQETERNNLDIPTLNTIGIMNNSELTISNIDQAEHDSSNPTEAAKEPISPTETAVGASVLQAAEENEGNGMENHEEKKRDRPADKPAKPANSTPGRTIKMLEVSKITVPEGRRSIDESTLQEQIESIKRSGLIQPITVSKDGTLIAGRHRLEAYRYLGYAQIESMILEIDDPLEIELVEIDENLVRHELHFIDMGELAIRRDEILEQLGERAKVGQGRPSKNSAGSALLKTTAVLAGEMGMKKRTLQQLKQLVSALIPEAKDIIRKMDITKTDALELSRLEHSEQQEVISEESKAAVLAALKRKPKKQKAPKKGAPLEPSAPSAEATPLDGDAVQQDDKSTRLQDFYRMIQDSIKAMKDATSVYAEICNEPVIRDDVQLRKECCDAIPVCRALLDMLHDLGQPDSNIAASRRSEIETAANSQGTIVIPNTVA